MSRARLKQEIGDAPIANDDEKSFGDRMLQGYAARVVELRVAAPRLAAAPSARPVASPLARLQAATRRHGDEPAPRAGRDCPSSRAGC